ncbi:MAG: hypothetical protein FWH01_01190 [Oscillospiraceae bacterium]|nr:hypothetical protein [Oscillospiraceae bacterium]
MKTLIFVLAGLCIGIFLIGGAFTLLGALFAFTFGIVGTFIKWLFNVLLTPAVLVLIIIILAYKLNKKSA